MNKKIKQYSALAFAAASVLPLYCSKDVENDENIDDKVVNKVLNAVVAGTEWEKEDSIDVNGDGQFDFTLVVGGEVYYGNTYGYSGAGGKDAQDQILSANQTIGSYTVPFATVKNSGDKLNASSTTWETETYFSYKENTSSIGFAGAGDKFLGFRFKAATGVHYGWMKVNIAADYKTLTIKELAYNKTPNAEIEVGAK